MQLKCEGGWRRDSRAGWAWGLGALTFSLSHDRKGTFAILGRGHLGVRGGGARGLSCSSHVRGGDVAVVVQDDRLLYSGLTCTLHSPHTACLENAPTRAGRKLSQCS